MSSYSTTTTTTNSQRSSSDIDGTCAEAEEEEEDCTKKHMSFAQHENLQESVGKYLVGAIGTLYTMVHASQKHIVLQMRAGS